MTTRDLLAAGALAFGLSMVASATSTAYAQPAGKAGQYFPRSVSSIPAAAEHARGTPEAKCDCPMMKGDAAMREQCRGMMDRHRGEDDKSGSAQ